MKVHDDVPDIGTQFEWDIDEIFTRHSGDTKYYQEEGWGDDYYDDDDEYEDVLNARMEMSLDDVWQKTLEIKTQDEHYDDVVESIRTRGFVRPCTAKMDFETKKLKFLDGHHRLAAAIDLGMKTVPVIVLSQDSCGVSDDSGDWNLNCHIPTLEESGIRI